jgi:hypothetical protein
LHNTDCSTFHSPSKIEGGENMKYTLLTILALSALISCKEEDSVLNYAAARDCLDRTTDATPPDDTRACADILAGDTSPRAYKIRCASEFLAQGLNNDNLADVFLNAQNSDSASFEDLMQGLVFRAADITTANTLADTTFTNCTLSESTGMILFAGLSRTATRIAGLNGWNGTGVPPELDGAGGASDAELGDTVLIMNEAYCGSGSTADSEVCTQLASIIAGSSDATAVGAALRAYIP